MGYETILRSTFPDCATIRTIVVSLPCISLRKNFLIGGGISPGPRPQGHAGESAAQANAFLACGGPFLGRQARPGGWAGSPRPTVTGTTGRTQCHLWLPSPRNVRADGARAGPGHHRLVSGGLPSGISLAFAELLSLSGERSRVFSQLSLAGGTTHREADRYGQDAQRLYDEMAISRQLFFASTPRQHAAPFSATERFISSTRNTSVTPRTADTQKTSK